MKITIDQPASVDDPHWDHTGNQAPAGVTVQMDDGTQFDFTARFRSVLDLNPELIHPETDFGPGVLEHVIREPGAFTLTMEDVRDVEISHPAPER